MKPHPYDAVDVPAWPTGTLPGTGPPEVRTVETDTVRFTVEIVTASGSVLGIEFALASAVVVIWYRPDACAAFDRVTLKEWLSDPGEPLSIDGVSFDLESEQQIAMSLPDGTVWLMSPMALEQLRDHL